MATVERPDVCTCGVRHRPNSKAARTCTASAARAVEAEPTPADPVTVTADDLRAVLHGYGRRLVALPAGGVMAAGGSGGDTLLDYLGVLELVEVFDGSFEDAADDYTAALRFEAAS